MKKIGILLGSFDPIHIGHMYMAAEVVNNKLVDEVLFVPAFQNPWKERSVDFWQRCSMIEMAISDLPNCKVSDVERLLSAPYYSHKTLELLKEQHPNDELYIIIGVDVSLDIKHWHNGEWILENFKILTVQRDGYDHNVHVDIHRSINVSSTYVRNLYKNKKTVYPLVPKNVDEYIRKYKIYE